MTTCVLPDFRFAHSVKAWFFQSSIPFPGRAEREISFLCNVMKTFKSITIESDCSFLCSGFQINDAFNGHNKSSCTGATKKRKANKKSHHLVMVTEGRLTEFLMGTSKNLQPVGEKLKGVAH